MTRPVQPAHPVRALVLMGGGARTAYQVGVLRALAALVRLRPGAAESFPFRVLAGTSAGALNTVFLAGAARAGLGAFDQLARFWTTLRSEQVYRLHVSPLVRLHPMLAALLLSRHARRHGALLDNMPLVDTLHRAVDLSGVDAGLQDGTLDGVAVTASSYTSGVHWTFCHTRHDPQSIAWSRPGRRAEFQPLSIEHLMASSAIPFLFPSTPLWVDGRQEYFGDGSMRQSSPLSPAFHLGAERVLVVGVGQPQRSGLAGGNPHATPRASHAPTLGGIAGHAMASVFHDTLQADVEQAQRINTALRRLPAGLAATLGQRAVDVLAIQPSQSLDAIAQRHADALPAATRTALAGLGGLKGSGAALASYLLFEPGFVGTLMALGEADAMARRSELMAFLGHAE